ncbi:FecCD transport family protein [Streptomyces sp. Ncost-T6T-2b]|nr:FecCD transport family protein [Streptomyces sp. Ncost-T6T-2b]
MTSLALRQRGRGTEAVPRPRRRLLGLVLALVLLMALLVLSLMIGSTSIAPSVVWDALLNPSVDPDQFAIRDFRLPRTVVGLVVGVALGLSGALIQALIRNPLADPGILGVHAGASFAVTVAVGLLGVRDAQGYDGVRGSRGRWSSRSSCSLSGRRGRDRRRWSWCSPGSVSAPCSAAPGKRSS